MDGQIVDPVFQDISCQRELSQLACVCTNRKHGCTWKGKLQNLPVSLLFTDQKYSGVLTPQNLDFSTLTQTKSCFPSLVKHYILPFISQASQFCKQNFVSSLKGWDSPFFSIHSFDLTLRIHSFDLTLRIHSFDLTLRIHSFDYTLSV